MTIKLAREYVQALRHVVTIMHWLGAAWVATRMMERVYPRLRLFLVVAVSTFMPLDTWLFAARRYFAAVRVCEDEAGKDEAGKDEAGNDEAGEDEAGKDEVGDDEAGKDEAGKHNGTRVGQASAPLLSSSSEDLEKGIMSNYRPSFFNPLSAKKKKRN